jgi:hypothetical protein
MTRTGSSNDRALHVVATAALTLAAVGFFRGTSPTRSASVAAGAGGARTKVGDAVSYGEMRGKRRGPNADIYAGAFDRLGPSAAADASARSRRATRAFAGAPPTVPHAIAERAAPACLACHEHGARIGDAVAARMSHRIMDNCLQCHAPAVDRPSAPELAGNEFRGLTARDLRGPLAVPPREER